ncbi:MAG TPA: outer membrane protein transport protein [Gemmatimonadales bacterium]|nr:outer membrane protein transport protein [Gemmatimonadales bacterium]
MRRFAFWLLTGVPSLLAAQGFGVYEHGTCAMGRAGVAAAAPCPDGSAIFFNPAGLAGLAGKRVTVGTTLIQAVGGFTDDRTATRTDLDNPLIPVPSAYFTYAVSPKATVGLGVYAPYGLETRWPSDFAGRFLGYNTNLRSVYVQPTVGYQIHERLKVGVGLAYIYSWLELKQRVDLSAQAVPSPAVPPGTTFYQLGIPFGTDIADAQLTANGSGFAVNFGAILKVTDRLSVGGHWLTRKTIDYEGDAEFTQLSTGLTLAANNPLGLPAGTPVDAIVQPLFLPGQPFANGGASTTITLPPQGSLGVAYQATDDWTVMADWHYVVWGWFHALPVDFENPGTPDFTLYEGYRDTHGFRLGSEYRYSAKYTVRAGYLYHGAAAPPETVTPLLPEGSRNEFTIGVGAQLTPKLYGDFGYQFIKQNDRRGRVHESTVGNSGIYEFSAHLVGVGLSYTF